MHAWFKQILDVTHRMSTITARVIGLNDGGDIAVESETTIKLYSDCPHFISDGQR